MEYSEGADRARAATLLILAHQYPPANTSGALRPFRFVKYLRRLGIESHVISANGSGYGVDATDSGSAADVPDGLDRVASALQYVLPGNERLTWVPRAVRAAERVLAEGHVSHVLSTSPPHATLLAGLLLKRRHGVRWIADLRDPIAGNPFRRRRGLWAWDSLLESWIIDKADAVIANTRNAAAQLKQKHPTSSRKVHLIWNGIDPEEEFPSATSANSGRKLLTHTGSLYGDRHPGQLLAGLSRLVKQGLLNEDGFCVRLVGELDLQGAWTKKCNLTGYLKEPWLETGKKPPRSDVSRAMAASDYLLLLDVNKNQSRTQVPGKLFEYVRIGRPILAFTNKGSDTEYILERSGIPHICIYQAASPKETDRRLLSFFDLPSEPSRPSEWFQREFDGIRQAEMLAAILTELDP